MSTENKNGTAYRAHFLCVEFACSFQGVAVVEEQRTVKEKHVAAVKIHVIGKK